MRRSRRCSIVLGAACVAVLVEAFLPRYQRWPAQVGAQPRGAGAGRARARALRRGRAAVDHDDRGRVAVDRPTLFLWGTLLALGARQRPADRGPVRRAGRRLHRVRRGPGCSPRPRQHDDRHRPRVVRRARPGRPGPVVRLAGSGADDADRGLPVHPVRPRRDDDLRRRQRPADDVHRARGAQPAAVPDVRAGPAAPAALAGGGGQVLPARGVRVGVLPVRPGAALRLRRLGAAHRHRRGVGRLGPLGHAAVRRARDCSSSACCSRARSARSTPGRRTSTRARRRR